MGCGDDDNEGDGWCGERRTGGAGLGSGGCGCEMLHLENESIEGYEDLIPSPPKPEILLAGEVGVERDVVVATLVGLAGVVVVTLVGLAGVVVVALVGLVGVVVVTLLGLVGAIRLGFVTVLIGAGILALDPVKP